MTRSRLTSPATVFRVLVATARFCLLGASFAGPEAMLWAAASADQEQVPAGASASDRFLQVKGWTGTFTMTTPLQEGRGELDNRGSTSTWRLESSAHGTVLIDQLVKTSGRLYSWEGSAAGTLEVNHRNQRVMAYATAPCDLTWTAEGTYELSTDGRGEALRSRLVLRRSEDSYDFDFIHSGVPVDHHEVGVCSGSPTDTTVKKAESFFFAARQIPLPATGLTLSGSKKLRVSPSALWPLRSAGKENDYDVEITWNLQPVLDDIELLVDSPAYEAWRPEAGPDEKTIGNEIQFEAKLQNPDGSAANVKAVKIIFELIDTSHEPGIALNFPLVGAGKDCDLQFSPKSNPPGRYAITGPGKQRAETVPGKYTAASIMVSSFDWGGWSTLRVTAELEDGRRVPGHFRNKSGPTSILLPKRAASSKIADSWKQDVGVSLPDNDDSEPCPAGNNNRGDGFTLYEEYRGFYVNGRHIAGDPKKIDFFVRNYIGADAEHGIALFADLTGAEVHAKLLDTEFDRKKRVMNGNHGQGAHRVDQHGVFLQTQAGLDGGLTVLSKKGVRGRPVIVLSVNLQPHNSLTGMTTSENVPVSDLARAYDRAVAHELLHTVGAEHHGAGDGVAEFYFHFGDDPQNATGKAYFSFESGPASRTFLGFAKLPGVGDALKIIDEASGRDLASLREGDMMLERETMRPAWYPLALDGARRVLDSPHSADYPWTAEQLAETKLNELVAGAGKSWYVGAEHGESSGSELCVMRYYFARLYEKRGTGNTFYYITNRRSERAGLELCRSPAGTGVNAKDREPQPRYGDAAPTRGACALSLIFNDAVPLKSDAIPPPPKPKP